MNITLYASGGSTTADAVDDLADSAFLRDEQPLNNSNRAIVASRVEIADVVLRFIRLLINRQVPVQEIGNQSSYTHLIQN